MSAAKWVMLAGAEPVGTPTAPVLEAPVRADRRAVREMMEAREAA